MGAEFWACRIYSKLDQRLTAAMPDPLLFRLGQSEIRKGQHTRHKKHIALPLSSSSLLSSQFCIAIVQTGLYSRTAMAINEPFHLHCSPAPSPIWIKRLEVPQIPLKARARHFIRYRATVLRTLGIVLKKHKRYWTRGKDVG